MKAERFMLAVILLFWFGCIIGLILHLCGVSLGTMTEPSVDAVLLTIDTGGIAAVCGIIIGGLVYAVRRCRYEFTARKWIRENDWWLGRLYGAQPKRKKKEFYRRFPFSEESFELLRD